MDEIALKKTGVIARQILLYFFDFYRLSFVPFEKTKAYRIPIKEYDKFREHDKIKFSQELYRLKKQGLVKKYLDGKGSYLELTTKGKQKATHCLMEQLWYRPDKKWDKKWRLVIFDIPQRKTSERNFLRGKLVEFGFIELQESVYVFPFDCIKEINYIVTNLLLKPHVQTIIADRIETEVDLVKLFYDKGILTDKDFCNI